MLDIQQFPNFDIAIHKSLEFLQECSVFDLWMVTQVDGDDWIVLCANDSSYGIAPGTRFRWVDSFCMRMVAGDGPHVAPDVRLIPAYRNAPMGRQAEIGAYAGFPIWRTDGSLFGTLCSIHPTPQLGDLSAVTLYAELLATLLGVVLSTENGAIQQACTAERAKIVALCDDLTSLYNRRGWNQMLAREDERCRWSGQTACIIVIDLDGMKQINDTQGHGTGDRVLQQAGQAIQAAVRQRDVIARTGGDEFAVLCGDCDRSTGEMLAERIALSFQTFGVAASLGVAAGQRGQPLSMAWEIADQNMYACKKKRKRNQL